MNDAWLHGLRLPVRSFDTWAGWWADLFPRLSGQADADLSGDPAAQAWLSGVLASGPEQAFLGGYQVALAALVGATTDRLRAFAATEGPGKSLRRPATRLVEVGEGLWTLSGQKSFVTLPDLLDECLVLASCEPGEDGRETVVVRLDRGEIAGCSGVGGLVPPGFRDLRFGRMTFDALPIGETRVLPGRGHEDYSRRFRWLEDHLVLIALLGWLLRAVLGHDNLGCAPSERRSDAETLLLLAKTLASQVMADGDDGIAALTFAAARSRLGEMLERWRLEATDGAALQGGLPVLKSLLGVAAAAQAKRREKAWLRFPRPEN